MGEEGGRVDNMIARLTAIPGRIGRAMAGWDETRLLIPAAAGAWSAADILAHMRASDDIMAPRFYAILARENPPLPAYDERRWAEVARYAPADFRASLGVYAARRAELGALLRRVDPAGWERTGTHETLGVLSLRLLLENMVGHEEEHCAQVEALTATDPFAEHRPGDR